MDNFRVEGNAMVLHPINYPKINELTKLIKHDINNSDNALGEEVFRVATHVQLQIAVEEIKNDGLLSTLEHRLSRHVRDQSHLNDNSDSTSEIKSMERYGKAFDNALSSNFEFEKFICHAGSLIKSREVKIRERNIRTVPDDSGNYTVFIEVNYLGKALEDLRFFIKENKNTHPLFTAIVANVMFTHCHPLPDANGRLSRVLFNLILGRDHKNFIPLTEFCHHTRSDYIISLRESFFFSEWDAIFKYFCTVINLLSQQLSLLASRH